MDCLCVTSVTTRDPATTTHTVACPRHSEANVAKLSDSVAALEAEVEAQADALKRAFAENKRLREIVGRGMDAMQIGVDDAAKIDCDCCAQCRWVTEANAALEAK